MSDNPATAGYWDNWYEDGPGVRPYEWYNLDPADLEGPLTSHLRSGITLLQVGVGNSDILEQVVESSTLTGIQITNTDISEVATQ